MKRLVVALLCFGCEEFHVCADPFEMSTEGHENILGCWLVTAPPRASVTPVDGDCWDGKDAITVKAGASVWLYPKDPLTPGGSPHLLDVECP